jgi:GxxExxY protein
MKHEELTEKIIQAFYKVYNTLGYGFLERVYLNALYIELIAMGFKVEKEKKILVYYLGNVVGDYQADLIVEEIITVD